MRICIVTPAELAQTETFIRRHIELLPHDIVAIHGGDLDYTSEQGRICDWHAQTIPQRMQWLNALPRFLEFRVRKRFFPFAAPAEICQAFLKANRIDLVLAEYGVAGAEILPACKLAKIPLVTHFHGYDYSRYEIVTQYGEAYRAMFDYASAIISVSKAMSRSLIELGCPEEKIYLNPYGPDPAFFDLQPDYTSNTLLAVGRHTLKKAPYLTLEAFRLAAQSNPKLRLCMIGSGELLEVCERLALAWGLADRVELVGECDAGEVRRRMGQAFAFLQHSVRARNGDAEGTPVAILEAGAAGLPVVATRHAGIADVVCEGETGFLVEENDVAGMAREIVALASDHERARQVGAKARRRIKERFSLEQHICKLDEVIRIAMCK